MQSVARSALVTHDAEDMYLLAADVAAYPQFLPWCESAEVLEQGARTQTARVGIAYAGVRKSFTTRNTLTPFSRIDMELVEGPFAELRGAWRFQYLRDGACRVSLDVQFETAGAMRKVLAPVFERIAAEMVDCFVARAAELAARPENVIRIEVAYAPPVEEGEAVVEQLQLQPPATIAHALRASTLPAKFPHADWAQIAAGVFGVRRPRDWPLADGDRVEIYRELPRPPVETRRLRARK